MKFTTKLYNGNLISGKLKNQTYIQHPFNVHLTIETADKNDVTVELKNVEAILPYSVN